MSTSVTQPRETENRRSHALGGRIARARLVLFWERFWPAILPALGVPALIAIFSLFGIWSAIPAWLHALGLVAAVAGMLALLWRDLRSLRLPSRAAAQFRLEQDGGVAHAALRALDDAPFENSAETASPLWAAHMADMRRRADAARLRGVREAATARDPLGLRFLMAGMLALGIVGSENWRGQLLAGLQPGAAAGDQIFLADLWIEPPAYTGKAPIFLLRAGDSPDGLGDQVNAPQGSKLVAQVTGSRPALSFRRGDDGEDRADFTGGDRSYRGELTLRASGVAALRLRGQTARWPIGVSEDRAPVVAFAEPPTATDDNRVAFTLIVADDFGVAAGALEISIDPDQARPLDAPAFDENVIAETKMIPLDGIAGQDGERSLLIDLQEDPWAGYDVIITAVVSDAAGQQGRSEPQSFKLPQRPFFNPLARAVVEQRRNLATSPDEWRNAGRAFDALTLAPEIFYADDTTDFLLLRTAFHRVMREADEQFESAIEAFWPLALQLEDEALELARQRLEAAQEALRQALERGASDDEISRLVENLRQAMNDYLQALAQSGQAQEGEAQANAQRLEQSDLDQMLDSIRDLAQSGAQNAARQMLSDLENMLNNLRLSQGGGGSGQGQGRAGEGGPAGEAGELIGRQRELADETFQRGQTPGETGDDLAGEERDLSDDVEELRNALRGDPSADPDGEAANALGDAQDSMEEAARALEGGDFDTASSAMERAIGSLREGAEALAREQMRQADAQGGRGRSGQSDGGETDPLGRPFGRNGGGVEVPGESEAGRSRAVIERLRRRLGEQGRSEEEIDYLERLLERF